MILELPYDRRRSKSSAKLRFFCFVTSDALKMKWYKKSASIIEALYNLIIDWLYCAHYMASITWRPLADLSVLRAPVIWVIAVEQKWLFQHQHHRLHPPNQPRPR